MEFVTLWFFYGTAGFLGFATAVVLSKRITQIRFPICS